VIGGGPAGYVAAIKAAQLGGRVALAEKDTVGGTCLNRGCIPTKTYLKSAELLSQITSSAYRGISVDKQAVVFDMKQAKKNKDEVVTRLTTGVKSLLKSNGVTVIQGTGVATSANTVAVGEKVYACKSIIFAGGSIPGRIGIPGIDSKRVLTSDEALDLEEIPKRLAVIGGGVIGVEMGLSFAEFGSSVTIIEMMDRIVPNMDEEVSSTLAQELKKKGISIMTSAQLKQISETEQGLKLELADGTVIEAEKSLLSIGRKPDLSGIEPLGVEVEKGRVKVSEGMQTSIPNVYAPGDVNGLCMLAHAAFKMGEVAAENAMGGHSLFEAKNIPSCIYTSPEVGAIGLTEKQASQNQEIQVGRFPFGANGRALASGEGSGFVKVISSKKYGEILGVHIVGSGAAEMINEASVLMHMEVTVDELLHIVHGHPTFSECLYEAGADAAGNCIHLPRK
jgi:dihydrolipoamide dehydrogenase